MKFLVLLTVCALVLSACALVEDVPPVADAGTDQTAKVGAPVTLDASKSREIDGGKIVEYRWQVTGVPKGKEDWLNKVLTTTTEAKAAIQLPADDGALGVWTIELRVSDDGGNRAANEVHVTLTK
jgi:chitinase